MAANLKVKVPVFLLSVVMLLSTLGLGFRVIQSDFWELIGYYTLFFLAYLGTYYLTTERRTLYFLLGTGVLLRFILVFSFPGLSDDVYRFIWDGHLIVNGTNPFNHLPSHFIDNQILVPGISTALFEQLNSPNYFTIYPPVCQGIFAISCWIFTENWAGSAMLMKSFLFVFESGSILLIIKLLKYFKLPEKRVLLYALNPLVIIEIMGNLHFEGAMVFFLLLSIWLLVIKKPALSAVSIAFSIAAKLLPLIFLPFLIKRLGWKKSISYFTITGITLLLLFSPLLNPVFLENFSNSLDLYFRKFEFNASIYYLLRWLGKLITGYNQIDKIGPFLGLFVMTALFFAAYREKHADLKGLFKILLFAISLHLFLATTIHPWYVILPLTLCIFTSFRYPILWSGVVMLTYINYSYADYFENLWIVLIEYTLVFSWLWWEFKTKKTSWRTA